MFQSLSIASFVTSWRDGVGRIMYLRPLPDYLAWPARIIHQWKEKPREEIMFLANSSWQLVSQIKKKEEHFYIVWRLENVLAFLILSCLGDKKLTWLFATKGAEQNIQLFTIAYAAYSRKKKIFKVSFSLVTVF